MIFLLKFLLKSVSKLSFLLLWRRDPSGFGAAVSGAVPRSVFCISVAADRIVMAASRFLAAVAACVMRLAFAAQSRESYGSGRIKVAKVICQQIS